MLEPPSLPSWAAAETDARKVAMFEAMTSVGKAAGTENGREGDPPQSRSLVSERQAARLRGAQ